MSKIVQVKVDKKPLTIALSKTALGQKLDIHRHMVGKYHRIAKSYLPDYRLFCRDRNGRLADRLPLLPFQQWVIKELHSACNEFGRSREHLKRWIQLPAQQSFFRLEVFEKNQAS